MYVIVCGAIHSRAGRQLAKECYEIGHCDTGDAVITKGVVFLILIYYYLFIFFL